MSETVLEEYGFKASMMAPGQMQAAERMAAECATLRARVAELEAAREAMLAVCTDADPHDRTYPYVCLAESGNPIIEAATLADAIRQLARWGDAGYAKAAKAEAQLATARAEERERGHDQVALGPMTVKGEQFGFRVYPTPAGMGSPGFMVDMLSEDDEQWHVVDTFHANWLPDLFRQVDALRRALTPTPEPPHV